MSLLILEAQVHGTTLAAHVAILGAVHELLLTQGEQLASGNGPSSLNGACGGECPAASTASLVLHWGHSVLGGPIHAGWWQSGVGVSPEVWHALEHLLVWCPVAEVCSTKLMLGHVGKLIELKLIAVALGVLCHNIDQVSFEGLETTDPLSLAGVLLAELPHPRDEVLEVAFVRLGNGCYLQACWWAQCHSSIPRRFHGCLAIWFNLDGWELLGDQVAHLVSGPLLNLLVGCKLANSLGWVHCKIVIHLGALGLRDLPKLFHGCLAIRIELQRWELLCNEVAHRSCEHRLNLLVLHYLACNLLNVRWIYAKRHLGAHCYGRVPSCLHHSLAVWIELHAGELLCDEVTDLSSRLLFKLLV
mmetsp:Transcript_43862/g.80127  ORF Transcript_43862/g.80127 Transcript_43862/m.80127 type:complete len:359 (+) Transcript_43862:596-1672(+)